MGSMGVDRTAEFFQFLADAGVKRETLQMKSSPFIKQANELRLHVTTLKRNEEGASMSQVMSEITDMKAGVAELEKNLTNMSDLEERLPPAGQQQDLEAFRRAVVRDLYEDLKNLAASIQTNEMERLRHENEVASFFTLKASESSSASRRKLASIKPPTDPTKSKKLGAGGVEDFGAPALADPGLAASLRAEEQTLLASFHTDLDQIHQVQQKLGEVASMVSVFANKAEEQQEIAEQILETAHSATTNIEDAGKHLQSANDNKSSYNFWIVCWFLGSGIFLLIFDFVDERYSWI